MRKFLFGLILLLPNFIDAQNVGIGTSLPPAEKLDVNGNTRISGYIRAQAISLHATTSFIPVPSAILDIQSNNQGVLIPRMTQAQRDAIPFPDWGLLIFQFNNNPGFYYNKGNGTPDWIKVGAENTNKGFLPFTTAGVHLLTVPQGVSSLEFEALSSGGGGGGGQVYNASFCGVGGGGGAGGYFTGLIKVNPGDIITITIGAPGSGGTSNTTPTPGNPGTDAGNTTIQVNGSLVLELTGGKGGSGGFSDGTQNSGVGISGGAGGGLSIYFASFITPYNTAGGGQGGQGASWGTGASVTQWGGGSFINAFTLYGQLDGSTHPLDGQGGRGGNNSSSAGNGVVGYVKFKY